MGTLLRCDVTLVGCRREQDKDRQIRSAGPVDEVGKIEGYEGSEERYGGFVEHDA